MSQRPRATKHLVGEKDPTNQRNPQQSKQTKQLTKEQNENKEVLNTLSCNPST